jgi:curli biogenesis system outer membrane secretion channel CsgG
MSFRKYAAVTALGGCLALAFVATPADAQFRKGEKGWNNAKDKRAPVEVMRCTAPVGTVAIEEPERDWWTSLRLANPERLIKVMASRSGCLRVVDRSRGLAMRERENSLSDRGQLQRRSNVGGAQIVSADYFLVPDLITADANSRGSAVGAVAGAVVGGALGGLLGNMRSNVAEAQVSLGLINARTTEEIYTAEGNASKRDSSFAVGGAIFGSTGAGGALGGGYEDTDIGRVVSIAYVEAFNDLVVHMQGMRGGTSAAAAAPQAALNVTRATTMRVTGAPNGRALRTLESGDIVYPTGRTAAGFVEVEDEFDAKGWVPTSSVSARNAPRGGGGQPRD